MANPSAVLYCARGGLRSQLCVEWLADTGVSCPRVEGGYKSLRGFLLSVFDGLTVPIILSQFCQV